MMLQTISWKGRVMGTDAQLLVVTDDVRAGEEDLLGAQEDLRETERVLSRFREVIMALAGPPRSNENGIPSSVFSH